MTPPRRAKLVLLVLAVALVGLGVWAWEPVYWWVTTRRVYETIVLDRFGPEQSGWWKGVMTRKAYETIVLDLFGAEARGWRIESRFSGDLLAGAYWYPATGYKAHEYNFPKGHTRSIVWGPSGSVELQLRSPSRIPDRYRYLHAPETLILGGVVKWKFSPPWWWGVTDQTEPSIPEWMKDDAKWQAALDGQR